MGFAMTDERQRDPKVSFRLPQEQLDAIDALAAEHGVSRSALLRRFNAYGLEANAEAMGVETRIANKRQEIIEFGKPIDEAGGFAGRVRNDFEERFKGGYSAKWLAAKAESYRREARMLEDEVSDHPDAPPIETGELVAEVDRVVAEALEAAQLSNWNTRYSNPFEKFAGVEDGRDERRMALALTRTAMQYDQELGHLRDEIPTDRRVRGSDLPERGAQDLPAAVSADDVARVARELSDQGLSPDDIETDPHEFDPFGLADPEAVDAEVADVGPAGELPGTDPEPDGGAVADGGGDEAILSYVDQDDDRDVGDLVAWAARILDDGDVTDRGVYTDAKNERRKREARENAEEKIQRRTFEADTTTWQSEIMDETTLTPDDLIELADDYNDAVDAALVGERDDAPEAVATSNGGVRIE
jgi:hypothetical protein